MSKKRAKQNDNKLTGDQYRELVDTLRWGLGCLTLPELAERIGLSRAGLMKRFKKEEAPIEAVLATRWMIANTKHKAVTEKAGEWGWETLSPLGEKIWNGPYQSRDAAKSARSKIMRAFRK